MEVLLISVALAGVVCLYLRIAALEEHCRFLEGVILRNFKERAERDILDGDEWKYGVTDEDEKTD